MRRMPVASAGAARRAARAHGAAACWVMCGIGDRAAGLARCARRAHPMGARLRRLRGSLRGRPGGAGRKGQPREPGRSPERVYVSRCASAAAQQPALSLSPRSRPRIHAASSPVALRARARFRREHPGIRSASVCCAPGARCRSRRDVCHSPPQHRLAPPHPTPRPGGALVALSCRPSCVEGAARTRPVAGAGAGAGDRRPL